MRWLLMLKFNYVAWKLLRRKEYGTVSKLGIKNLRPVDSPRAQRKTKMACLPALRAAFFQTVWRGTLVTWHTQTVWRGTRYVAHAAEEAEVCRESFMFWQNLMQQILWKVGFRKVCEKQVFDFITYVCRCRIQNVLVCRNIKKFEKRSLRALMRRIITVKMNLRTL